MTRLGRRGVIVVALAISALVLAAAVGGRLFGRKRLRFPYLTGSIDPALYRSLAAEPGWHASQIAVAPGVRLNGLVRPAESPQAPWVLFYQGNDAAQLRVGQEFLRRLDADHGFGLAVYAYRGYDSSDGTARLADLATDAPEILAQLCRSEHVDRGRVHIVGFSIGGHFAARAMAEAARSSPKPASLTLLASVDDIVMYRPSFYARLDPGDDYQTRPFLAAIPAPVLVVQGTADEALLGAGQGRAIAGALADRAKYVELAGVGHVALLSNDTALAAVRDFVTAHAR